MKIKLFLSLIFIILANAVSNAQTTTVGYASVQSGKKSEEVKVKTIYKDGILYLSEPDAKVQSFIEYPKRRIASIFTNADGLYAHIQAFDSLPQPKFGEKRVKIMGYDCKYAVFSSFSNTIEVWYTEDAPVPGSPYSTYLPSAKALVLKVMINGGRTLEAISIEKEDNSTALSYPIAQAKLVSGAELEGLKIKSRYHTLPVFKEERVNFDPSLPVPQGPTFEVNTTYRFSKGSVILKKITIPDYVKNGDQVFVDMQCWSDGDAYDRTGSVFMLPADGAEPGMLQALVQGLDRLPVYTDKAGKDYQGIRSEGGYTTPIELMRFFTSFGVRYFNNLRPIAGYDWKQAATYKQDITDLFPTTSKEVWIGVFIGNYDKGGHKVSLNLDFYPGYGKPQKTEKFVMPLFNTINIMEMSGQNYGRLFKTDSLHVDFELPKNIKNLKLLYTTTGHGGWGTGDEFTPILNQIRVNQQLQFNMVPWRTDCATYRPYNPASGNFGNGMSSSDLSRSNWCPGTLTAPYVVPLPSLEAGSHSIQVDIQQGNDQGNSFSHWGVSGILVGERVLED
ncbi:peptide-N-glycosidase F-like protein [Dyadobacter jejuensis]|uniref:Peptide-N-glycosidase F-like protein n=1 Tax=Dyadobacter jejuensis TaxID=1082580 RepID=A0A316AF03_9BACT|nr:PNGase F N-terminal domain-containing protein [Dyadobacter jejuensis]PWJ55949.1 peptide-N-glycosidase F-like protein [Dyadobacter jejuensis]